MQAAFDFTLRWNVSHINITNDAACAFFCDTLRQLCCDAVWVPRLRIANAKGRPLITSSVVPLHIGARDTGYNMLYWNVQLEGTFNFDLDNRLFPMDQQNLGLTLVNLYPSTTYFHYLQPDAAGPSSCVYHCVQERAALYNSRLQARVSVAGGLHGIL